MKNISLVNEYHLDHLEVNRKIEEWVNQEMIDQRGLTKVQHSNIGGWQSHRELHAELGNGTPISHLLLQLFSSFAKPMNSYIDEHAEHFNLKSGKIYDWNYTGAWFNVSVPGSYNAPHTHPFSQISAAYYVHTENEPPKDYPFSGRIDFFHEGIEQRSFPTPGTLFLFPGSMLHFVHPYYGKKPRICLSFNSNNIHAV